MLPGGFQCARRKAIALAGEETAAPAHGAWQPFHGLLAVAQGSTVSLFWSLDLTWDITAEAMLQPETEPPPQPACTIEGPEGVTALAFHETQPLLFVAFGKTAELHAIDSNEQGETFTKKLASDTGAAGAVATTGIAGTLRFWLDSSGTLRAVDGIAGPTLVVAQAVTAAGLDPTGKWLAAAIGPTVQILNAAGAIQQSFDVPAAPSTLRWFRADRLFLAAAGKCYVCCLHAVSHALEGAPALLDIPEAGSTEVTAEAHCIFEEELDVLAVGTTWDLKVHFFDNKGKRIKVGGDAGTLPLTDRFEEQNVLALGWDYSCAQPVPNALNPTEKPYPACPLLACLSTAGTLHLSSCFHTETQEAHSLVLAFQQDNLGNEEANRSLDVAEAPGQDRPSRDAAPATVAEMTTGPPAPVTGTARPAFPHFADKPLELTSPAKGGDRPDSTCAGTSKSPVGTSTVFGAVAPASVSFSASTASFSFHLPPPTPPRGFSFDFGSLSSSATAPSRSGSSGANPFRPETAASALPTAIIAPASAPAPSGSAIGGGGAVGGATVSPFGPLGSASIFSTGSGAGGSRASGTGPAFAGFGGFGEPMASSGSTSTAAPKPGTDVRPTTTSGAFSFHSGSAAPPSAFRSLGPKTAPTIAAAVSSTAPVCAAPDGSSSARGSASVPPFGPTASGSVSTPSVGSGAGGSGSSGGDGAPGKGPKEAAKPAAAAAKAASPSSAGSTTSSFGPAFVSLAAPAYAASLGSSSSAPFNPTGGTANSPFGQAVFGSASHPSGGFGGGGSGTAEKARPSFSFSFSPSLGGFGPVAASSNSSAAGSSCAVALAAPAVGQPSARSGGPVPSGCPPLPGPFSGVGQINPVGQVPGLRQSSSGGQFSFGQPSSGGGVGLPGPASSPGGPLHKFQRMTAQEGSPPMTVNFHTITWLEPFRHLSVEQFHWLEYQARRQNHPSLWARLPDAEKAKGVPPTCPACGQPTKSSSASGSVPFSAFGQPASSGGIFWGLPSVFGGPSTSSVGSVDGARPLDVFAPFFSGPSSSSTSQFFAPSPFIAPSNNPPLLSSPSSGAPACFVFETTPATGHSIKAPPSRPSDPKVPAPGPPPATGTGLGSDDSSSSSQVPSARFIEPAESILYLSRMWRNVLRQRSSLQAPGGAADVPIPPPFHQLLEELPRLAAPSEGRGSEEWNDVHNEACLEALQQQVAEAQGQLAAGQRAIREAAATLPPSAAEEAVDAALQTLVSDRDAYRERLSRALVDGVAALAAPFADPRAAGAGPAAIQERATELAARCDVLRPLLAACLTAMREAAKGLGAATRAPKDGDVVTVPDVLQAYEAWRQQCSPAALIEATDAALQAARDALRDTQLLGPSADDAEEQRLLEPLRRAEAAMQAELAFANWDPVAHFPAPLLLAGARHALGRAEAAVEFLRRAQQRVAEWEQQAALLKRAMDDGKLKAQTIEQLRDAKEHLAEAQLDEEEARVQHRRALLKKAVTAELTAKLEAAQRAVSEAKARRRAAVAELVLAAGDFPELACHVELGLPEPLVPLWDRERCLSDFEDVQPLPGETRHPVYRGRLGGQHYAIKAYHIPADAAATCLKEATRLVRAAHPHVVEVVALFQDSAHHTFYLQMPFYAEGPLDKWAEACQPDVPTMRRALLQVFEGVAHLHRLGIIHSDLKPSNLLVAANGTVRVGDLDVSVDVATRTSAQRATQAVGFTRGFAAPELLHTGATTASDAYSLGVVLRVLGERSAPCMGPEVEDLIQGLCAADPAQRPPVAAAMQHAFFRPARDCLAAKRECCVKAGDRCGYGELALRLDLGVECSGMGDGRQDVHFVCDDCLQQHVRTFLDTELRLLQATEGRIWCPECHVSGHRSAYTDQQLAQHLPADIFGQYLGLRLKLTEQQLAAQYDRELRAAVEAERRLLVEMDERQRRVREARQHITESILNLRCPRCHQVFVDFTGCCALACSRCPCMFCAWCGQDCGRDAHGHVAKCPQKPAGIDVLFASQAQWAEQQRLRRQRLVGAYLASLAPDIKQAVQQEMRRDLADLNLTT
eukprot:EG_transcript_108